MNYKIFFILLCFFNWKPALAVQNEGLVTFLREGREVATLSVHELQRLVTPRSVKIIEPYYFKKMHLRGLPIKLLLNKIYGKQWNQATALKFTCKDGYTPVIPLKEFIPYQAYLTYAFAEEKKKFSTLNRSYGVQVQLGPLYLVWNTFGYPLLLKYGVDYWPYQIKSIDLTSLRRTHKHSLPGKAAPKNVREGFYAFKRHCFACHKIRGEGGDKGGELARGPSFSREYLRRFIDNPRSINARSLMPRLSKELPQREIIIEQVIDYLLFIKKQRKNS